VEIFKDDIPIEGSPFPNKKKAAQALNTTESNLAYRLKKGYWNEYKLIRKDGK